MHICDFVADFDLYGRNSRKLNHELSLYKDSIWIKSMNDDRICNAKSLLGVLSLCIKNGDKFEIMTDSDDYKNIFSKIESIFKDFSN